MEQPTDDELLERLARELAVNDTAPDHVIQAAKHAFTTRANRVINLTFDSATEEAELVGIRGSSDRILSFHSEDYAIDIEAKIESNKVHVVGQLSPLEQQTEVQNLFIDSLSQKFDLEIDQLGRFTADVPRGRFRICIAKDDQTVATQWIEL